MINVIRCFLFMRLNGLYFYPKRTLFFFFISILIQPFEFSRSMPWFFFFIFPTTVPNRPHLFEITAKYLYKKMLKIP